MPEFLDVEAAKTALATAQAAHENVLAEIKKAEAAIAESAPAAAVAAGISLADAAAAHHRGHNTLGFLQDAREHAWQNVLTADAALKTALVHSQWTEKQDRAIATRIAAVEPMSRLSRHAPKRRLIIRLPQRQLPQPTRQGCLGRTSCNSTRCISQ